MKRLYLPLLVALLSSLTVKSQTHFITAGQTQGMIFTDYVPDKILYPPYLDGSFSSTIDINHDGYEDVQFSHYRFNSGGHSGFVESEASITALDSSIQIICSHDSSSSTTPCNGYHYIPKPFTLNDSISNTYGDSFYYSNYAKISYSVSPVCRYGLFGALDSGCYFMGRLVANADTSLFYIHLIRDSYGSLNCLDYAIEGPTSSYIISSINKLQSDISISTFPNPFTHQININYPKPFEYELMDYVGRMVMKGKAERSINTAQLAAGNYLLVMKNEEMYCLKKVVRE